MPAPQRIKDLVKRFSDNFDVVQKVTYKEEDLRANYLHPFFEALGWDMTDSKGKGANRDVRYEEIHKKKAPDYAFYADRKLRFFVEAKKPAEDVCNDAAAALQVRGYGWSAKLTRSIVTDFEELSIYDTTVRPKAGDQARVAKIECIKYTDFVERWDDIVALLSYEKVLAGSLDAPGGKYVKQAVDDELLDDISRWREILAKNIALRNEEFSDEQINRAVQDTLDRIIFLRICEDRSLEEDEHLKKRTEGENTYEKLFRVFKEAEKRYDSGLFEVPHAPDLKIDDKVLTEVISELYFPKSPYKFDAIPTEILGQVYEQFLGKIIRKTKSGRVTIDEKPEVRKAGGIYYTPKYIVDYIVRNTVGTLVEGKAPKDIKNLTVVDPACGSGTFLIGAYEYLMDWYRDWYAANNPMKHVKDGRIFDEGKGRWQLTLVERRNILLAHIYGVDIDRQACEVAKLSLMLKALEAEAQKNLFNDRMLPNLSENIKCGNALIGTDYFSDRPEPEPGERGLINPFDYDGKDGFPEIMARGGFDAVIGNPPYVRQESLSSIKEYLEKHYESADGTADLYAYFMEKGVNLLKKHGLFSIIVSSSFLRATYGESLRQILKEKAAVVRIVDFGGLAVFDQAKDTYVCIPLLAKDAKQSRVEVSIVKNLENLKLDEYVKKNHYTIPGERLSPKAWSLKSDEETVVFEKIVKNGQPLGEYVKQRIFYGIKTGLNDAFVINNTTREKLISKDKRSSELIHPLLGGEDIRRYVFHETGLWLIFTRRGVEIEKYPAIRQHLENWKEDLVPKQDKKAKRGRKPGPYKWYEIQDDVAYYEAFDGPKIIYPDICKGPRFCLDGGKHYLSNTAYCLGTDDRYLLGVLNSRLFWFAISNISIPFGIRAGQYRYRLIYQYMEKVPIHVPSSNEKTERDQIIKLVEQTELLHSQLGDEKNSENVALTRQIDALDRQIDQLVYKLYGLTDEEIRIVEGKK